MLQVSWELPYLDRTEDRSIELNQGGLTDQIPEALVLDITMATNKRTPTENSSLAKRKYSKGLQGSSSYNSVLRIRLYLPGHCQPDIAYAVNRCVKYMFNARLLHEKALKYSKRYHKATRDRGLIMRPVVN